VLSLANKGKVKAYQRDHQLGAEQMAQIHGNLRQFWSEFGLVTQELAKRNARPAHWVEVQFEFCITTQGPSPLLMRCYHPIAQKTRAGGPG